MKHELLMGTPVDLADGSTVRVRTIPFTDEGYAIARMLDMLSDESCTNEELLDHLLDVCHAGLRLNYPSLEREQLGARLDITSAHAVIAALRGETGDGQ